VGKLSWTVDRAVSCARAVVGHGDGIGVAGIALCEIAGVGFVTVRSAAATTVVTSVAVLLPVVLSAATGHRRTRRDARSRIRRDGYCDGDWFVAGVECQCVAARATWSGGVQSAVPVRAANCRRCQTAGNIVDHAVLRPPLDPGPLLVTVSVYCSPVAPCLKLPTCD